MTTEERTVMQKMVNDSYSDFVASVSNVVNNGISSHFDMIFTFDGSSVKQVYLNTKVGSWCIYPDWEYQQTQIDQLDKRSLTDNFTTTDTGKDFIITETILDNTTQYAQSSIKVLVYEKSTGILANYTRFESYLERSSNFITQNMISYHNIGSTTTNDRLRIPGFQFYWLSLLFLVPMIRRKYAFSTDFFHN